ASLLQPSRRHSAEALPARCCGCSQCNSGPRFIVWTRLAVISGPSIGPTSWRANGGRLDTTSEICFDSPMVLEILCVAIALWLLTFPFWFAHKVLGHLKQISVRLLEIEWHLKQIQGPTQPTAAPAVRHPEQAL